MSLSCDARLQGKKIGTSLIARGVSTSIRRRHKKLLVEKQARGTHATRKVISWIYDMKGHAENCVESYCELANKSVEQLFEKFPHPVWMIISSRKMTSKWWVSWPMYVVKWY